MRRLARRLGLRRRLCHITRYGDCASPWTTFEWEQTPEGSSADD